jgi:redox-regulated HSP33 family molecular chaperone
MADVVISFDGSKIPTKTVSGSEKRLQLVREEGVSGDMVANTTLNSQTAEVTVFEDTDSDGNAENTQKVTLSDGENGYTLSNLQLSTGNEYWSEVELTNSNIEKTAEIHYIELRI